MQSFLQYLTELKKPAEIEKFKNDVKGIDKVDSRNQSWGDNLPDYFAKHGWKKLGSGKYASVFGSSKYPYIIKVFMKDAALLKWLQFAAKNQKNPYVPKLKGGIVRLSDTFFALRMEKLNPVSSSSYEEYNLAWSSYKKDPDSVEADLRAVFDQFKQNKNLMDMHSENIMDRPGGTFVIIDPYYNWFNKSKPMAYTIDPDDFDPKSLFN